MDSGGTYWQDLAALDWQRELGADEAIADAPIDRYALAEPARPARQAGPPPIPAPPPEIDPADAAAAAASVAPDLPGLAAAMRAAPSDLAAGARNFVFADGLAGARVMVVGEAPGREEDIIGRPFVGRAGQLLDRMLAAIGLDRGAEDPMRAVYIANVLPWRPEGNRTPEPGEIAQFLPFLLRHIALARPDFLVLMGNTPCHALLGRGGITQIRGRWSEVAGLPALPMFHPAYLLRNPAAKREAWADLLALRARLDGGA